MVQSDPARMIAATVVGLALLSVARAAPAQPATVDFDCTAGAQTWQVPPGIRSIVVSAFGAQGGNGPDDIAADDGGLGGHATRSLPVTPGELLQVNVGCRGGAGPAMPGAGGTGGFNGGGDGGASDANGGGAGGGGASDVRRGAFGLADRLIVAGGGGGGGGGFSSCGGGAGGGGGGTTGIDGSETGCPAEGGDPGLRGTATAGGSGGAGSLPGGEAGTAGTAGVGGAGGAAVVGLLQGSGGGGGGGGWFGGGARTDVGSAKGSGGGGGSGFGPAGTTFESAVRRGDGTVQIAYLAVAAPAMSQSGLMIAALLLAAFGLIGMRRAATRRSR